MITQAREIAAAVAREWRDDRVSGLAAEVAFFSLLSVFPGLLAFAAMLESADRIVGGELALRARINTVVFLEGVLTSEADRTISAVESLFEQSSGGVLTLGVVLATWSISRAMAVVVQGLNLAYDIEEGRSWLGRRLAAIALALGTLVVGFAAMAVLILGPLLGGGAQVADWLGLGREFEILWTWIRPPTIAVVVTAWIAVVFHFGPFERTAWRWHLPGAVLAAGWWTAASAGFRVYLDASLDGNQVFGVLGGGLTLMVWLYLLSLGLLVGAEVNAELAIRADVARRRPRFDLGAVLEDAVRRLWRTLPTRGGIR